MIKINYLIVLNFIIVTAPFLGETNAICWNRILVGDFSEIINQIELNKNIAVINQDELWKLKLSELGHLWKLAIDHPESPVLPFVHRAPKEKIGQNRLLLIC
jgi:hypothetical protein